MLSLTLQHAAVNDPNRKLYPTRVRALRRALKGLCDSGVLMAVGDGGPSDAYRYCINPLVAAIGGTKEQYDKAIAMLQADPGANVAMAKWMAKYMTAGATHAAQAD